MKLRILSVFAVVALAACDKPSESDCRRAIENIRALLGTDKLTEDSGQTAAWIRSCVGSAKKTSVRCAMEASTVEALQRCGLVAPEDMEELAPGTACIVKPFFSLAHFKTIGFTKGVSIHSLYLF